MLIFSEMSVYLQNVFLSLGASGCAWELADRRSQGVQIPELTAPMQCHLGVSQSTGNTSTRSLEIRHPYGCHGEAMFDRYIKLADVGVVDLKPWPVLRLNSSVCSLANTVIWPADITSLLTLRASWWWSIWIGRPSRSWSYIQRWTHNHTTEGTLATRQSFFSGCSTQYMLYSM